VAKTEGFSGSFASLDSQGRYTVRMPFDDEKSCPIDLAQNFAGENCGVHFPLRKDTPVLIAFEDGDIDKPVALGALPRENCKSPVAGKNSHLNMLKTASGISICFDDSAKSLEIEAPMDISIKAGGRLVLQGSMVEIN
jgi:type VI secretion system secreted protein VgrG